MKRYILILFLICIQFKSYALIEVDITRGNLNPLPIAVSPLSIDDQSKKVSLAFKLFDSEGVSMINMLQNGSGAIKEMGDQLEDFGGIIDDDAIKATERFNDAVNLTSKAVRVVFSEAVLFLSDAFERMGRGFDKIFGSAEKVKKVSEDQTAVRIKQTQIENEYVKKLSLEDGIQSIHGLRT